MTIVCSLHYLDLVQRYATRVIGLKSGKLVYQGTKQEVIAMSDKQFKEIYGEEAEQMGGGLQSELLSEGGAG